MRPYILKIIIPLPYCIHGANHNILEDKRAPQLNGKPMSCDTCVTLANPDRHTPFLNGRLGGEHVVLAAERHDAQIDLGPGERRNTVGVESGAVDEVAGSLLFSGASR